MTAINYRTANVDGRNVFYREAGAPDAPKLLLLHGSPRRHSRQRFARRGKPANKTDNH